jgi:toxin CcdB
MPQFAVHRNKNVKTKAAYPYLLDVQSDLLDTLETRVVIPLAKLPALRKRPIKDLTPVLQIEGHAFLVLVPLLAGIARSELGAIVGNVAEHRNTIVAALDFLITGV